MDNDNSSLQRSSKRFIEPTSFEEIMRRSSSYVDDYALGMQFPASDWTCYFLFSSLFGDGPCHAVNLGVHVGHMHGADLRVPGFTGDQNGVLIVAQLVYENRLYRWFDTATYKRTQVIYSRSGLDLQIGDVVRIKGTWPFLDLYYNDKENDIVYRISGKMKYAHWVPDHVMTANLYSFLLFPEYTYSGTVTFKGKVHEIAGIGGFDKVTARLINNPATIGVGYWHYDPVTWNEEFISNGLFYLGRKGETYIKGGVMTIPDGGYHPADSYEIEYLEFAESPAAPGSPEKTIYPQRWRATMQSSAGRLVYETTPIDLVDARGDRLLVTNVAFHAEGEFRSAAGKTTHLKGKGYMEYLRGTLDPSLSPPA